MSNPIRKLPAATLIYGLGEFLTKATSLLLMPVLTRVLTPAEFGVLGSVMAFTLALGILLQLSLNSAVFRFYPDCSSDAERRVLLGTLMMAALAWAAVIVILLNSLGATLLGGLFREVAFEPYLRLGTWIAVCDSLAVLPLALVQMQQRPLRYRLFTTTKFLVSTGLVLVLVVVLRMGPLGSLLGQLAGSAIMAGMLLVYAWRHLDVRISAGLLRQCLLFSLPLMVYTASGWFMDLSNRVFIERFVSLDELGRFNIGTQLVQPLGFVLNAVGLAFTPLFYETVRMPGGAELLARFGRYYVVATVGLALALAVVAREALLLLTTPEFYGAYQVTPVLVATQALTCAWHLTVNPLMLHKRTAALAGMTLVAAAVSVGLNLWLVPAYGALGAALAPLGANLLLNGAAFVLSRRLYPVPYSYGKLGLAMLAAGGLFLLANAVPAALTVAAIGARLGVLALYPPLLVALGIVTPADLRRGVQWLQARAGRRFAATRS